MMLLRNLHQQSKAWGTFALIALAGALAVAVTLFTHHREEDANAQRQFQAQMEWLSLMTANELQKSDYDHLRHFLTTWANKEADVVRLSVRTRNGFEIVGFHRTELAGSEFLQQTNVIPYGIDNEATLHFSLRPSESYHMASGVARRIALLFIVFIGLAAVLLRQKLLRQQEAEVRPYGKLHIRPIMHSR